MNPIISIIIPCYNSEFTLQTTLESVISQDFQDWEAIIINDGSIDKTEEIALNWTKKDDRFKYFSKHNEGLAKTRNYGIARSSGEYILPLDADNQLEKDFVISAITIFEKDSSIGVVHGDAEYFGQKTGLWKIDEFNLSKMLLNNYIDACAIYKKKLWEQVGGYDEKMPFQGHEDWELWLALGTLNVRFHHLKKITFKYFFSNNSMIRSFTNEMLVSNQDYVAKKYSKCYKNQYAKIYVKARDKDIEYHENLKSEKFVINLFFKTFFGFKFFKLK